MGYLAATAAFIGMLGIMSVERLILRSLLTYQGWLYLRPKQSTPLHVTLWGTMVYLFSGKNNLLYGFELSLPSLPLPKLKDTVRRYLRTVEPLLTEEEYAETVQVADAFCKEEGKRFQRYLWLRHLYSTNYISEWWEKYVYLRQRTPIMVNSNYYICDTRSRPTTNQISRAACLTHYFLVFKDLIESESLEPMLIRGKIPLCMEQYERMFGTTRVPGRERDQLKHCESRYIIVVSNGYYYELEVYHGARGTRLVPYTTEEIEFQLKRIVENSKNKSGIVLPNLSKETNLRKLKRSSNSMARGLASSKNYSFSNLSTIGEDTFKLSEPLQLSDKPGIAAFTAGPRSNWAEIRELYFSEGMNRKSLRSIERAAFILCLEDKSFPTLEQRAQSLFHGDGLSRWFDKSINLVVFSDGYAGLNVEHSWADAPAVAHMWEFSLLRELAWYERRKPLKVETENAAKSKRLEELPLPIKLNWEIEQELRIAISQAGLAAQELIRDVELRIVQWEEFGASQIKKCRISPDAFVQMALQIAYYRVCNRFDLTYEASMTRLFRRGRTETVRSLSLESVAFVKAMVDKTKSKKEVIELLKAASERHNLSNKDAMTGKGVDRHLFALYIVSRGLDVNSEFLNQALSIPWRLSTSQQPQKQTNIRKELSKAVADAFLSPGGGFGPVADDGYGVSYMVLPENIFFHISSKRSSEETSSTKFQACLRQALREMKELFD